MADNFEEYYFRWYLWGNLVDPIIYVSIRFIFSWQALYLFLALRFIFSLSLERVEPHISSFSSETLFYPICPTYVSFNFKSSLKALF